MLCIAEVRMQSPPVHQKVLTVQVYGRSLVQCWFSRDRDVEKLRKALEKKAVIFVDLQARRRSSVKD